MRRAARRDKNEGEIRTYLENLGFVVAAISSPSIPDMLIYHETWGMWLLETKSRKGKLTPAQIAFMEKFKGAPVIVARDINQVLAEMGIGQ